MESEEWYYWSGKDLLIRAHIQTRAKRDEVVNIHNGRLKIRITAPPIAGKANKHLAAYLAAEFNLAKSEVEIIKGPLAKDKLIKIHNPQIRPDWFRENFQNPKTGPGHQKTSGN